MNRLERLLCDYVRRAVAGEKVRPPMADGGLIHIFGELSLARSWNANGPNAISFPEIEAWCRLMRVPLEPRHIRVILAIDGAWMAAYYEKQKRATNTGSTLPAVSSVPLTPALMDAMMG